ncbi:hypothetical protein HMI56_005209 [Coelomomyces lativittatus]|nr:hypothetical protein HMI56_005209 [Coelomomyces lativittatus]
MHEQHSVGVSVGLKHFEKKRHQLNQDVDWFTKQQTGASSPLTLPSSSSPSDSQPPRPWLPPLLPPKYEYAYQWDWSSTHDGGGRGGKTGDESFASLSSTSTKKTPTLATSFKDDLTSTTLFPPLSNLSSYGVSRLDPSTYHLETAMIQHVIQHGTPLKPLGTTVGCYVSHSSPPPPSSSSSSSSTH